MIEIISTIIAILIVLWLTAEFGTAGIIGLFVVSAIIFGIYLYSKIKKSD